jgi:hypothetical protein
MAMNVARKLKGNIAQGDGMNTTLIEGKPPAEYDATVLNTISLIPKAPHHEAARQLLIGVRNERGDVYRAIKVFGKNAKSVVK